MRSPCCKTGSRIIGEAGRYAGAVLRRTRVCAACGKSFATHESVVAATSPPCKKRCAIVAELTQKVEDLQGEASNGKAE